MKTPTQVDPIKFEVIRNALLEATEEMTDELLVPAYASLTGQQAEALVGGTRSMAAALGV